LEENYSAKIGYHWLIELYMVSSMIMLWIGFGFGN